MKKYFFLFASLIILANPLFAANADYKFVLVATNNNAVRVRLPLTDVTGKVRVKEKSSDGFGLPVAPMKTWLNEKFYLEWQIGYDLASTNSPTVVPEIRFTRNGETKYGHELSKIIFMPAPSSWSTEGSRMVLCVDINGSSRSWVLF